MRKISFPFHLKKSRFRLRDPKATASLAEIVVAWAMLKGYGQEIMPLGCCTENCGIIALAHPNGHRLRVSIHSNI